MEERKIWFDRVLNDTKKIVAQAAMHELRKHPLLKDDLDDLIQDTYLELYKKYGKLRNHENITGWLVETVKRKTKDRTKRLYREINIVSVRIDSSETFSSVYSDYKDIPEASYLQQEKSEELRNAITQDIGEEAYRLLEAHYVYKQPLAALAEDNGISTDAMKMRFFRWKKHLRKKNKFFMD